MSNNLQLLKLVRAAATSINRTTSNAEYKALLAAADFALNELMLQDSPAFYLEHLAVGKNLLMAGCQLASIMGMPVLQMESLRDDLHTEVNMAVLDDELNKLNRCLVAVVNVLDESRSSAEKNYLVKLSDWENSLYTHRLEPAAMPAAAAAPITPAALQQYLQRKFPEWRGIDVTGFMTLDGGFSKKTILFETTDDVNGQQSLVMRAEQPVNLCCYDGSDVTREFYMIQLMRKAGLPIAEPLWLEADASQLGARFIVSRKAPGKTLGGNLGSDQALSNELLGSIMATFVQMHNIKLNVDDPLLKKSHLHEWLPYKTVREATQYYVTGFMHELIRRTDLPMTPQLQRGLKWLRQNIPDSDEAPVIVHIDFALNNLIIDDQRVTAVLDWESSRLGDPAEDVIWTQQNLGAYLSMPEFLRQYQAGTGRQLSEYRLAYCKVAKCALNAITCLSALRAIDKYDATHINLSILAFKYMALFGAQFNQLIADAERVRGH